MTYPPDLERLHRWTPDEYLAFERSSSTRHELIDGYIYDMVGVSRNHSVITTRLTGLLDAQLLTGDCVLHSSEFRVGTPAQDYFYPDLSVACGDELIDNVGRDTLFNPIVLFEVLSPSTAAYDRSVKLDAYTSIPSLQHYVLIEQASPRVHVYSRQGSGWFLLIALGLDAVIDLPAIGCTLALRDLYARVNFDATED